MTILLRAAVVHQRVQLLQIGRLAGERRAVVDHLHGDLALRHVDLDHRRVSGQETATSLSASSAARAEGRRITAAGPCSAPAKLREPQRSRNARQQAARGMRGRGRQRLDLALEALDRAARRLRWPRKARRRPSSTRLHIQARACSRRRAAALARRLQGRALRARSSPRPRGCPAPVCGARARARAAASSGESGRSSDSAPAYCAARALGARAPARRPPCSRPAPSASSSTPFLMPCSSSPAPGCSSTRKKSTMRGDRDLGLPDADGLDDHHVVARRLAHEHRLARALRDAAERPARGRGPDERALVLRASRSMRVLSPRMLPPVTGLDGIDRQHRDAMALPRSASEPERLDEAALADARRAGDADARSRRRCRHERVEDRLARARPGRRACSRAA